MSRYLSLDGQDAVSQPALPPRRWQRTGKWRSLTGSRRRETYNGDPAHCSLLGAVFECLRLHPSRPCRPCRPIAASKYKVSPASSLARLFLAVHIGERRQTR